MVRLDSCCPSTGRVLEALISGFSAAILAYLCTDHFLGDFCEYSSLSTSTYGPWWDAYQCSMLLRKG